MMNDVPDLTGPGRETLSTLYNGPLRLREILAAINADEEGKRGKGKSTRNLTESAIRKRLEGLISRGIVARTGSERINPYYFIRRQWLFNYYIMTRCRDGPDAGLLNLSVLLHDVYRQGREGVTALSHPHFIATFGERTERGHQVAADYASFKKHLGDSTAIDNYLEGIYSDIYDNRVPTSDIDGQLARDFLRFVVVAPKEESEFRFFIWYAGFFHTLDLNEEALETFDRGVELAKAGGFDITTILDGARVSRGTILLYLNKTAEAKQVFLDQYRSSSRSPFGKAKNLFGTGQVELINGEEAISSALGRFSLARNLCQDADPDGTDMDIQELRGDILRLTGAAHRIAGRFADATAMYEAAETIFKNGDMFRGRAKILPEQAELLRAQAFSSAGEQQARCLSEAARKYEEAKTAFQRIRNIRGYAHTLIGECELARIAHQKAGKPLPADLDTKFDNAFEVYCQINSRWGIVKLFIAEALLYHHEAGQFPEKYADTAEKLEQSQQFSRDLGLTAELALIRRIQNHSDPSKELNPLVFL
jgi:tetratricopeptide (TPR) repeat protein